MYRTKQIQEFIGLNRSSLQRMLHDGTLPSTRRPNGTYDISREDIAKFIVDNQLYYERFIEHEPSDEFKNSYYILRKAVEALNNRSYKLSRIQAAFGFAKGGSQRFIDRYDIPYHISSNCLQVYESDLIACVREHLYLRRQLLQGATTGPAGELRDLLLQKIEEVRR